MSLPHGAISLTARSQSRAAAPSFHHIWPHLN